MKTFTHKDAIQLLRKPPITVYFGPCPWEDCVRATTKGRQVLHNGQVKTVSGIESYAKAAEPRLGEIIGLAFDEG